MCHYDALRAFRAANRRNHGSFRPTIADFGLTLARSRDHESAFVVTKFVESYFVFSMEMKMGFVVLGLLAGILSGFFGIGGGLVIVPALMMFWQMQPQTATGTSLGALLLPVGILGAWQYYRTDHLDARAAGFIAIGLLVGALLGATVALELPTRYIQRAFAAFLICAAIRLWWTS